MRVSVLLPFYCIASGLTSKKVKMKLKRTTFDILNLSQLTLVLVGFVSYLTRLENYVACDFWPQVDF